LAASLIYQSAWGYELLMLALYGRHYAARYRAVAQLIPPNSSVLELCCGPGTLYRRHLRTKTAVVYTGLDINRRFVEGLVHSGARSWVCNLRRDERLPEADYVIIQGSLYHFLPEPARMVDRMLYAARRQVIVAESIRNLANSRWPALQWLARRYTDAGLGRNDGRFDEATLDSLFGQYGSRLLRSFLIPGGREKVYVLEAG
jgi:SAM-dependent methyltransferase